MLFVFKSIKGVNDSTKPSGVGPHLISHVSGRQEAGVIVEPHVSHAYDEISVIKKKKQDYLFEYMVRDNRRTHLLYIYIDIEI